MKKPTGVSRRIHQSFKHLQENDFEGSLVNLFPALDKTAKRRRAKDGVARRIKAFLEEEMPLISIIAMGFYMPFSCNGNRLSDVLYKFGRTSIAHEGELDSRLEISTSEDIIINANKWHLPSGFILGMSVAVITAPENIDEFIEMPFSIEIYGKRFNLSELWGNSPLIKDHIANHIKNTEIFK
ncbi:hypothetical protein HG263_21645 [Pseudoalteromonas sp. JBTF-M23]|uniref:Uncharacterized protein n=1 Tax=Pseudoalteromonas caenipelagi TaxID=2726988 RepID=A0A849VKD1_9GAMM|nr:hypothetical protein [Pseudoalteromonas caenipelagi]NOU53108.1 hypothetical protein [Pseudoalteromonas caenipelagi]